MPDRNVDYTITAKDEASGVFATFRQNVKEANAEARASGDKGLETLLKGGGALGLATLAAQQFGEMAKTVDEDLVGIANHTKTWGDLTDDALSKLPVFGQFYSAAKELVDVFDDIGASVAKAFGMDGLAGWLESDKEKLAEIEAAQKKTSEFLKQNDTETESKKKIDDELKKVQAQTGSKFDVQRAENDTTTADQKSEIEKKKRQAGNEGRKDLVADYNRQEDELAQIHKIKQANIDAAEQDEKSKLLAEEQAKADAERAEAQRKELAADAEAARKKQELDSETARKKAELEAKGQRDLAEAAQKQKELALARQQEFKQSLTATANVEVSSRLTGVRGAAAAGPDPAQQTAQATAVLPAKIDELIDGIAALFKQGNDAYAALKNLQ